PTYRESIPVLASSDPAIAERVGPMAKTLAVLVAVLAIMATACGGGAGAPATTAPAGTSAAVAATKTPRPCCTKLVAAYSNISADDWFAWYAFEKGIFKDNGLDV